MAKLTKTFVERVEPPAAGHTVHWDGGYDGAVKGYGLRVSSHGKRVFFVMGRVYGKQVQFTIGPFGQFTEKLAREKAQTILQQMREGIDPRDGKRAALAKLADDEVALTTLKQVLDAMASGEVAPDVGRQIIDSIGTLSNARAVEELEGRIITLEARQI